MYQKNSVSTDYVSEGNVPEIQDLDKELEYAREQNKNLKKQLEIARLRKENSDMAKEINMLESGTDYIF